MSRDPIYDSGDEAIYALRTSAPGPSGRLPLEAERLKQMSSGELFGWTQNAGMGWSPAAMLGKQFLILSTQGGIRAPDGSPIALGYHTGHWEVGLLMEEAARTLSAARAIPFAGYVSDPCDGRTNGTAGMLDVRMRRLDFDDFEDLVRAWVPLTIAVNSLNRSMGLSDLYPFVLAEAAIQKIRFVHDVIERSPDAARA